VLNKLECLILASICMHLLISSQIGIFARFKHASLFYWVFITPIKVLLHRTGVLFLNCQFLKKKSFESIFSKGKVKQYLQLKNFLFPFYFFNKMFKPNIHCSALSFLPVSLIVWQHVKGHLHVRQNLSDFSIRCNLKFEFWRETSKSNHLTHSYLKYKLIVPNIHFPQYFISASYFYGYSGFPQKFKFVIVSDCKIGMF